MTTLITGTKFRVLDASGNPVNNAKIWTYEAGTLTPKTTYSDFAGSVPNSNPVRTDAAGTATIRLGPGYYRFRITDSADVLLPDGDIDGITGAGGGGSFTYSPAKTETQTATAGQTVFTLTNPYAPGTVNLAVYVDGLRLSSGYTETNSTTVTFASGLSAGQEVQFVIGSAAVASVASGLASLEDYGARADGVTDCLAAFNQAVAAGNTVIHAPGGNYYFSAGITIPQNVAVIGGSCMPCSPPQGTRFTFALATPVCVTLGGTAANNGAGRLQNVSIVREAGTIPANSVGLQVEDLYGATVEDVMSYRHAIGVLCKGDSSTQGITYMFTRVFTGTVTDAHVVVDTVPECRFSQCRFGMNGAFDQNCNDFIRIQGGSASNPAHGPNTVVFQNCQFNQGQNTVTNWLRFASKTPGSVSDTTLWQFDGCYAETYSNVIASDSTWPAIQRLQINNCTFNVNAPFFNLNAATTLDNCTISDTLVFGSMTVAPSSQINFFHVSNCQFLQAVSLTGPTSGSTAVLADCNFANGLTLAGTWASLQVKGGAISTGSLTNTATGGVNVDIYPFNTLLAFTPALRFGGATTGITYTTQSGVYRVESNVVYAQVTITLSNKGSATGTASIALTGLPEVVAPGYSVGNSGGSAYTVNMQSLGTSPVTPIVGAGPIVNLYKHTATGVATLTEAEFTNTSQISFAVQYVRA